MAAVESFSSGGVGVAMDASSLGGEGGGVEGGGPKTGASSWKDITSFLNKVCTEMETGQLIHAENFSLYEAMAALEMMDPKMDAGMLLMEQQQLSSKGSTALDFKTAEEAIEAGAAPLNLGVGQMVDVMDQLLAAQATWHSGHSLAQTVFTCVYLADMPRTQSGALLLHSFGRALIATCNLVRTVACRADLREEEDFVTASLGLALDEHVGVQATLELRLLRQRLEKQAAGTETPMLHVEGVGDCSRDELNAVLCRTSFLLDLFDALDGLERIRTAADFAAASKRIDAAAAALGVLQTNGALSAAGAPGAAAAAAAAAAGGGGGEGAAAAVPAVGTASGRRAVGFFESINYALLAPAPPRTLPQLSWKHALEHYAALLRHLGMVCQARSAAADLRAAMRFLSWFNDANPGPVARSYMQLVLFADGKIGGANTGDFVLRSAGLAAMQGTLAAATKEISSQQQRAGTSDDVVVAFCSSASRAVQQVLQAMCVNSARGRRRLGKHLVEWNAVLDASQPAEQDARVQQYCLATFPDTWWRESVLMSFTVDATCRAMLLFLTRGFPLQLYSPSELTSVYWYMDSVLNALLHNGPARETALAAAAAASTEKQRKGKGHKEKSGAAMEGGGAKVEFSFDLLLLHVYQLMCKAYVRLLVALTMDGKLPQRPLKFNTEKELFEQRFEALRRVHLPEPVPFSTYKQNVDATGLSPTELFQMVQDYLQAAAGRMPMLRAAMERELKASTAAAAGESSSSNGGGGSSEVLPPQQRDWLEAEVAGLEKAVMRTATAVAVAHRAGRGPSLKVSFDFSVHPVFAVLVLKRAT